MAATAGSIYQLALQSHLSGSPPQTDPQRSSETFQAYKQRMAAQSLAPDIGSTESDADYLVRIEGYTPTPASGHKLWAYATVSGSTITQTSPGLVLSRLAVGVYGCAFNYPVNNSNYATIFNGFSGSLGAVTASCGFAYSQSINNFTMSTFCETAPVTPADFTSGSIVIFNS